MAVGKPFKDGPAYISDSAADLYTSPDSALVAQVRHIHLVNGGGNGDQVVIIYLGSTGGSSGGTEIFKGTVPENDVEDVYFPAGLPLTSSDFISAVTDDASTVTATITGDLIAA